MLEPGLIIVILSTLCRSPERSRPEIAIPQTAAGAGTLYRIRDLTTGFWGVAGGGARGGGGGDSSVASVLGSLPCLMQRRGFDPPLSFR